MLEQHPGAQPFADFKGSVHLRWIRLQQPACQPVVVARPVVEERRARRVALLSRPQTFNRVERRERFGNRLLLRQRVPHQPQSCLPGERKQDAADVGRRQADRLSTQRFGLRWVLRHLVQRQRPEARGADLRVTEGRFELQAAAQMRRRSIAIRRPQEIAQHPMRLRLGKRSIEAVRSPPRLVPPSASAARAPVR